MLPAPIFIQVLSEEECAAVQQSLDRQAEERRQYVAEKMQQAPYKDMDLTQKWQLAMKLGREIWGEKGAESIAGKEEPEIDDFIIACHDLQEALSQASQLLQDPRLNAPSP